MIAKIRIPKPDGTFLELTFDRGDFVFLVGANGGGKSSLMHTLYSVNANRSRRISAHRQTWFASNAVSLSARDRRSVETDIKGCDVSPRSRWTDDYSVHRTGIAIFDLVNAENVRANSIAAAVDAEDLKSASTRSKQESPIRSLNEILRLSNTKIEILLHQGEEIVARKSGGQPYSAAELSDGERNALLLAATVLTVPSETLLLIDEPERHLHRSIISPLLSQLLAKRPDCAFVVSTHEVELPLDNPKSKTLLIRGCSFTGGSIASWDVDLLDGTREIEEPLKRDILGARRRILFVEGDVKSLDVSLYAPVFPDVSVIAKSGCRDVINAVSGIRNAHDLHWVAAYGIIDNDGRSADQICSLRKNGVYATPFFAVESIYYHTEIQRKVAIRHSEVTGEDADRMLEEAQKKAIETIRPHTKRLSEHVCEHLIRNQVETQLPDREQIRTGSPIRIEVDTSSLVMTEIKRLNELLDTKDLCGVIGRYPVRETPALAKIAECIGFRGRAQYENSVRQLLSVDPSAVDFVRGLFDDLFTELCTK
jgi:ABC-type lipoprotein export system ATPase subunit